MMINYNIPQTIMNEKLKQYYLNKVILSFSLYYIVSKIIFIYKIKPLHKI